MTYFRVVEIITFLCLLSEPEAQRKVIIFYNPYTEAQREVIISTISSLCKFMKYDAVGLRNIYLFAVHNKQAFFQVNAKEGHSIGFMVK